MGAEKAENAAESADVGNHEATVGSEHMMSGSTWLWGSIPSWRRAWSEYSPDALVPSWYQRPSAMFDTCVLQHFLRGLRSAVSEVTVKLINALSVWAVMTDEDHISLVLTDPGLQCIGQRGRKRERSVRE